MQNPNIASVIQDPNIARVMQDPNMQKMLYPYLPEGMRNPQTFEWMMSNPEYRSQLEQMLEKQVRSATLAQAHILMTTAAMTCPQMPVMICISLCFND